MEKVGEETTAKYFVRGKVDGRKERREEGCIDGRKENNSLLGEKEFPYLSKQTTVWVFLET